MVNNYPHLTIARAKNEDELERYFKFFKQRSLNSTFEVNQFELVKRVFGNSDKWEDECFVFPLKL